MSSVKTMSLLSRQRRGWGEHGNKGASVNLAVVFSGKLAVGCGHMAPDHPSLVFQSVGIQRLIGFGVLNGRLFK